MFRFDNTFVRDLHGLFVEWQPAAVPHPELLLLDEALADELALDSGWLRSAEGVAVLAGNHLPAGAAAVAQAYAGHQFGGYSPRLGDGRALLLGELVDRNGQRRDLHLKGSGRTPFARGGDGKAAVGPMLREMIVGAAMHALGVPTTRALAVVATGEQIARDTLLPGAVLTRVAASHLRVGSFQYAANDLGLLTRLTRHAAERHHPAALEHHHPDVGHNLALGLLAGVVEVQAALVAMWMQVGFVHGVMNTDNMTISGETIDYGPCAFLDDYRRDAVFSSIDHHGRYAFANQPSIALWNLARLAETLLPLIHDEVERAAELATGVLHTFKDRYRHHWSSGMRAKLGLPQAGNGEQDAALVDDLFALEGFDFTGTFRALANHLRGAPAPALGSWVERWRRRIVDPLTTADRMDRANPLYIPRNHLVEEALAAAAEGDLHPTRRLLDVLAQPYTERAGLERYAQPAPSTFGPYRTFCGT